VKCEYSTNNFESQISQAHRNKTEAEVRFDLPVLYSRKADEKADIQKAKNSVKEAF